MTDDSMSDVRSPGTDDIVSPASQSSRPEMVCNQCAVAVAVARRHARNCLTPPPAQPPRHDAPSADARRLGRCAPVRHSRARPFQTICTFRVQHGCTT